ncbi:antibiotic biosynthesis monooxygenase [Novosphingobium sp. 1949]|uniref:Antibiotic biosynthesis monooxygenase n=1 Tax=Novosphingobium organovorum TaxID=2930092 RepID=A0ABT0BGK6_9SPHN|nr:antibiotic biosynthesis monooxygenase [Novosphingobium organovorum]MCJ2184172.1 antibiotic biosynthesis monooxygenase [Novosphingobium organovorum]
MYVNVFRSRKRAGYDAQGYAADAARMGELASQQPGFIAYKSFSAPDGETLTMSEWDSHEAAMAWQRNPEHARVQQAGRGDYYESYTVYSCTDPVVRRFDRSED